MPHYDFSMTEEEVSEQWEAFKKEYYISVQLMKEEQEDRERHPLFYWNKP